ncbi:hypothetical protein BSLA_02r1013 [Burkholderia stabilis]|nr:hypothetical protein BSLA_02r1013 [Burkholderia stabilis]
MKGLTDERRASGAVPGRAHGKPVVRGVPRAGTDRTCGCSRTDAPPPSRPSRERERGRQRSGMMRSGQ